MTTSPTSAERFRAARRNTAVNMVREGYSTRDVADWLGVGKTTVSHWAAEAGVRPRWQRYPQDVRDRGVDMVRNGATYLEAARQLGVAPNTVRGWCRTAGVRSPWYGPPQLVEPPDDEPELVIWVAGGSFYVHTTDHATFTFKTPDAAAWFVYIERRWMSSRRCAHQVA